MKRSAEHGRKIGEANRLSMLLLQVEDGNLRLWIEVLRRCSSDEERQQIVENLGYVPRG